MANWLDRTGVVTAVAFAGGAILAVVVVLLVVLLRDGGGDSGLPVVAPTLTAASTPGTPTAPAAQTPTARPSGTPTASFSSPDDAVAAFVQDELAQTYIGECPPAAPSGETLEGYCSIELYRSAELATFNVGRFGSEAIGEIVGLPNADGSWSVTFLEFPPLDAQIKLGGEAMVFQAQDCLRFRSAPSADAEVISCQIDGTSGSVAEGPVEAGGQTWWRIAGLGWASASYLAPLG